MFEGLNTLCETLAKGFEVSAEYVGEHIEELGRQICSQEIWTSVVWLVLGAILVTIGIICICIAVKELKRSDGDEDLAFACGVVAIFTFIIGVPVVTMEVLDIVKVVVAPEAYLIDYCKGLLSSGE